jgi:hypothetical protein
MVGRVAARMSVDVTIAITETLEHGVKKRLEDEGKKQRLREAC